MSHLQVLAGDMNYLPLDDMIERFNRLTDSIPEPASRLEQLVIGELLRQTLTRLHVAVRCEWVPLEPACLNAGTFRDAMIQLRLKLGSHRDPRLVQFQHVLVRRYAVQGLSAAKVAVLLDLSVSHLIRLLKRQTGHGFPWHLQHVRMANARQLLMDSDYSIKEISSRVGYGHTSQFDRHFQKTYGATPTAYRQRRPRPLSLEASSKRRN